MKDESERSPFYGPEHRSVSPHRSAASSRAKSSPMRRNGTRLANSRANFTRRPARSAISGLAIPQEYGGVACDRFMTILAMQELARCGSGGVCAGLFSHAIAAPPILHRGSAEMKARVLPQILSGEKIAALAITEPERRL